MNAIDRGPFLEIIMGFAELKGKSLSAPALELYWNAMQAWSIEDFRAAANQLIRTCEWMPMPKHFEDLRKAGRETAGEVFGGLRQWLKYGPYGYTLDPNTPRPIAAAIRAMGGADAYAMCEVEKLPFLEKRFCEHYDQITGAEEIREELPEIAYDLAEARRTRECEQAWNFKLAPPVRDPETES